MYLRRSTDGLGRTLHKCDSCGDGNEGCPNMGWTLDAFDRLPIGWTAVGHLEFCDDADCQREAGRRQRQPASAADIRRFLEMRDKRTLPPVRHRQ